MTKEEAIQKLEVSGSYYREMIEFHDDKDVALVAVKKRGISLRYCSDRLKNDFDVVSEAINQDIEAINFVSKELKNDSRIHEIGEKKSMEDLNKRIKEKEWKDKIKREKEIAEEKRQLEIKMDLLNRKVTEMMDEVSEISKQFNLSQSDVLNVMKILELRELNKNIQDVSNNINNLELLTE